MSQSSKNPIRQALRRVLAKKILASDWPREMRAVAQRLCHDEINELTRAWLAGTAAAEQGDREARDFFRGTFGPWASEILRLRRS
jgi:hypothetical protein